MTAIVLLCLPADHERGKSVIDALVEAGLDAQWFCVDPAGPHWDQAAAAARAARCAIFAWSAAAHDEAAAPYRALAAEAIERRTAIGVALDSGDPPAGLEVMTIYRLPPHPLGWLAGRIFLNDIVAAARFKAAGRDPPPPSAPRQMLRRQLWLGFVSVAGLAALLTAIPQLHQTIPWPRFNERKAWAAIRPGSCADLLAFRKAWPDGAHAAEAQARYDARARTTTTAWVRVERGGFPALALAGNATPLPSEAAARAEATARAQRAARAACEGHSRVGGARVVAWRLRPGPITCTALAAGTICGMAEGEAVCTFDEPEERLLETCAAQPR